ncbi:MAG: hypothetical protein K2G19_12985, partial [Lachnospiraceae bacterium]|nr:hypothetical protein [Lachnospiraceae bacterium]
TFFFDNEEHTERFTLIYLVSLLGSVIFPRLPQSGWPYLAVFVGLELFGSQALGLVGGCELLLIATLLSGEGNMLFFVYFVAGFAGCMVFSCIDKSFRVREPLLVALLIQAAVLFAWEIILAQGQISLQIFIIPAVNTFICFILLMVLLKILNYYALYIGQKILMEINDPAHELLGKLREFSEEEYDHALHTAYLCEKTAAGIGLEPQIARACGYYHRIGLLKGDNTWENMQGILKEYHFPKEVADILKEYAERDMEIRSKEVVILFFCDTIDSSLNYLFLKKLKTELNYQKIIDAIFKNKVESGMIDNSSISLRELHEMKNILTEEKLYHDFLR